MDVLPPDCSDISIHTPAKGVTAARDYIQADWTISIHTPAKGVTLPYVQRDTLCTISIHTPAKGVTSFGTAKTKSFIYFNPHPREGGDPVKTCALQIQLISIHTPAKGVTCR